MHIHILGICGTFMGGIALMARDLGHEVSGSDTNIYPPMSTQLEGSGIRLLDGYAAAHLQPAPDLVIVGNALSRGNPCVEHLLDQGLDYVSGPGWLRENILRGRHVLALSGTHGKTTTTSMLAWILESAGLNPGFLVGGIPENFGYSARLGAAPYFVIEADEYDTAFFDKRSKFIHYRPRTLVIGNIEYDHADIFPDISAIRREFHHLVRTIPASGLIIARQADDQIQALLGMGCWTPVVSFGLAGGQWRAEPRAGDYSAFHILNGDRRVADVEWGLIGGHNAENALAAILAAAHAGIEPAAAAAALARFRGVKRRLERLGCSNGITVYDDFAHHPGAVRATLDGLRSKVRGQRIIAVLEPRSYTMKHGTHRDTLAAALATADHVLLYQGHDLEWDMSHISKELGDNCIILTNIEDIIQYITGLCQPGDHVVIMSNGGFENLHQRLLERLPG